MIAIMFLKICKGQNTLKKTDTYFHDVKLK